MKTALLLVDIQNDFITGSLPVPDGAAIIELNHMFLRLCGPPSIPLSFTVAGVLPRWIT
ncbi:hypothetical protein T230_08560 [Tannerella sp. oral taxon BU063 isolate Cell 1/3]|uniref:Isochorismatase-like domain-containing protein n=1 Tax=Tannerella sp. oral taxon BU063 isolate Cell 1/3 TaxID=1411022 RepID=W2CMU2_9BACT|nr:hypothetical protein T230_08560 [Tannerella sp. oral taxon BU063 isolate Cell 1/3]